MAQRRSSRSRRRQAPGAAERWLLLIGVVAFVVIAAGVMGPWRPEKVVPNLPEPMSMAEARASNARVPIEARRWLPPIRYRFRGGPAERAQATECLATAALYEAGDDRPGQRAVIQVILNRVRAPGFPRTICGVVYQGSSRVTGCQFSFTCDGSIRRRTIHWGWGGARRAAREALAGRVYRPVGRATHYHTDWMVPYWRDTMVKVAKVRTHLFYIRA
ncbi:spore germination cell wall hydrolase CwlJ-like protein [Sphingomonas jinjuensis]|uniref:Spore germination cell wall hydrolase CwlJ-like protein n=1 Tax=Sphingomonas jinjuensis TaxID=535907 RepID=A0A840FKQ6_9SPHN|nr:cell wall hydrolase [Sphingomonas jinjuensis]MBB4153905.1 spore germination cell wall hydrolase CwlJ-like protein [Sphingomonas jinjuensis]